MFPIELNQGGNYLIIRLCLARPGGERERWGGGEGWKEERGDAGGREGGRHEKNKKKHRGKEERGLPGAANIFIMTEQEAAAWKLKFKGPTLFTIHNTAVFLTTHAFPSCT